MPNETALPLLRALSDTLLAGILLMLLFELWRAARNIWYSSPSADAKAEGDDAGAD